MALLRKGDVGLFTKDSETPDGPIGIPSFVKLTICRESLCGYQLGNGEA